MAEEKRNTLTITDRRTGIKHEIPIVNGAIESMDLKKIRMDDHDPGLLAYDADYRNTAVATSAISHNDHRDGSLTFRGYSIEALAEHSSFLEVAFLLIFGELPSEKQFKDFSRMVMGHGFVHNNVLNLLKTFRYDAHPMGMFLSALSGLSTFHPEANPALSGATVFDNMEERNKELFRILGQVPVLAACSYRHRIGRPYNLPETSGKLTYTENFLSMLDRLGEFEYKPNSGLAKCLDTMFLIYADHEMNTGTAAMRHIASSGVDPYNALAGAYGAMYGPLYHGRANELVIDQLKDIGKPENIPQFLQDVKDKKKRLMGFGHRVYKAYDPRAKIAKRVGADVFKILGADPLWQLALDLEAAALKDDYFVSRKLFPNVDFFSGLIYRAMGFPTDMFPVLFAIPRTAGFLANWVEMLNDKSTKIYRPRQVYTGEARRPYVPMNKRKDAKEEIEKKNNAATLAYKATQSMLTIPRGGS